MPLTLRRAALGLALLCAAPGAVQAEPPLPSGRFRVGSTGIMCVKEPCPRIGIVLVGGEQGRKRSWPIYSGATPPRLVGADADRAAVERAWSIEGCLIVEGAFLQPAAFEIRRVVEDCRR